MGLREDITGGIITAMKQGEKLRLSTLRLLLAAVKNKEIEMKKELSDGEIQSVVATLLRQSKDSIEQFKKGGRDDLAEKEEKEAGILQAFMPAQLSAEEIRALVTGKIDEVGAEGMGDMGRVMKVVMPEIKGRSDGGTVKDIVKDLLGG
ncbi:MAG: GatB/YqeY domain-containing protein [Thermodesulfobacteriota bacterium]